MTKRNGISIALVCMGLWLVVVSGCGGGGGTPTVSGGTTTYSGTVTTPGGAATYRLAGRSAAQLAAVTSAVTVEIYAVTSAGETLLASGTTSDAGVFSITLPAGTTLTSNVVIKAFFDTAKTQVLRCLPSGTTGVVVSPESEAVLQVIEEQVALDTTKSIDDFSTDEISQIQAQVATALASMDYSGAGSISDAVTLAKNELNSTSGVTTAIASSMNTTAPTQYAIFSTSDYSSSQIVAVTLNGSPGSGITQSTLSVTTDQDSVVEAGDRYVYVISRGGNALTVLDPRDSFSVVSNVSTGDGSNPQDVEEISSTKAYVTRYGAASVLILNPATGAELGTIDLSAFADSDGTPEMSEMVTVGTKIFVTLQKLTNFSPTVAGQVVVIDTSTDTVVDVDSSTDGTQAITLNTYNPQFITYNDSTGLVYVSSAGDYFDTTKTSGVETINTSTYAVTSLLTSSTLAGNYSDLKIVSSTKGYVLVSNKLYQFNPSTGTPNTTALYTGAYAGNMGLDPFGYLIICDNRLYAGDSTNSLAVFYNTGASANAIEAQVESVGSSSLPPYSVAFITVPAS